VALWQFITFTVLIGALLVCASVITRRLGRANTRLKSIEEILLANGRSIGSADSRAAEAKAQVSGGQESRGGYLTIRDLRPPSSGATGSSSRNSSGVAERGDALKTPRDHVMLPSLTPERGGTVPTGAPRGDALITRSEQLSPQGTRPVTVTSVPTLLESRSAPAPNSGRQSPPGAVAERGDALKTPRDHVMLPSLTSERGGTVPIGAPRGETLKARSEQLSSQGTRPLTVTSVPTILESRSAPAPNSGRQSPPDDRPPSDESVAKKNREMTLFLMNQRRRRRGRLGY
jgi:hypothetical protein